MPLPNRNYDFPAVGDQYTDADGETWTLVARMPPAGADTLIVRRNRQDDDGSWMVVQAPEDDPEAWKPFK